VSVAIDTNVLIRWVMRDDPEQAARADAVMEGAVTIPLTVLVETVWVLKGRPLNLDRAQIAALLDRIATTRTISIEHEVGARWAINRYRSGADFADMIHLVSIPDADAFVTFDRRLLRDAGDDPPLPIETLA
jgi:predicted nucleic-acid-binding protein